MPWVFDEDDAELSKLLLEGPPNPLPVDADAEEANNKWLETLVVQKDKAIASANTNALKLAASPTGNEQTDGLYAQLMTDTEAGGAAGVASQLSSDYMPPGSVPKVAEDTEAVSHTGGQTPVAKGTQAYAMVAGDQQARLDYPDYTQYTVQSVEDDPVKQETLKAHVAGFPDQVAGYLLSTYASNKERLGDPYDAYRKFLLAREDVLRGAQQTGWPEYPQGDPTPAFWNKYTAGMTGAEQQSILEMYNAFRGHGMKFDSESAGSLGELGRMLEEHGFKPGVAMDSMDALRAVSVVEKFRYPNGRPKGISVADLLLQSAIAAPFGPVAFGGAVTANFMGQADAFPEGTPESVKVGIMTALSGLGGPGSLLRQARFATALGGTTTAAFTAEQALGGSGTIGATVAPILTPGAAGLARQQFAFLGVRQIAGSIDEKALQAALAKTVEDLKPDDIGMPVVFGDQQGIIAGTPTRELVQVQMNNGIMLTLPRAEVLVLPGAGRGATLASEAARLKAGLDPEDFYTPLQMTEDAIADLPVGETRLHYTEAANVQNVFKEGFKPSPASREALPGVYVTKETGRIAETGSRDAMFVEVPNGPMASPETVARARANLNAAQDAAGQEKLAKYLQEMGYVGAETRPGVEVYFNPATVKPRLAASTGAWDDFVEVANGVMSGKAQVTAVRPVGGGAVAMPDLSPELNALGAQVTNNALDLRMAAIGMAQAAQPPKLPTSLPGKLYTFSKAWIGINPGILKSTTPAILAAAHYDAAQQAELATRLLFLKKGVTEAFGKHFYDNPQATHLLGSYKGPALTGKASDYVIGTLAHAIDRPDLYDLTPKQTQVIGFWQTLLKHDFELTKAFGVKGDMLDGNYVPYRYTDDSKSWWERLGELKGSGSNAALGSSTAGYSKHRYNATLDEFAESLAREGQQVELDPFKLYQARLQGSARLRADHMFLNGVVKQFGQEITPSAPQQAIRDQLSKTRTTLRGKMFTSIRQEARSGAQGRASSDLDKLLTNVEHELGRINDDLDDVSPIASARFERLEAQLVQMEKEANRVSGFALNADVRQSSTEARLQQTLAEIDMLRTNIAVLKDQVRPARTPRGWTEIAPGSFADGKRWMVPDDVATEIRNHQTPSQEGLFSGPANAFVDFARSQLLSADISFLSRHGYNLASVDPVNFFKKFGAAALIARSQEGYLMDLAQNLPLYADFAQSGGTLMTDANDVLRTAGGAIKGPMGKLAENIPVMGQIQYLNDAGFGRLVPFMKTRQWVSMTNMLENIQDSTLQNFIHDLPVIGPLLKGIAGVENMSPQQLKAAAADVMNNVGGGVDWSKVGMRPSLASKMIFLTEGWLRANVGNITMAARVGDPRGVLARRFLFQQLAITSALATALSVQYGARMPNYDPTASDFLDIQLGDVTEVGSAGSISLLPGKTYIRTIFRELLGTPDPIEGGKDQSLQTRIEQALRFAEGRVGQPLSLGADMLSGKDYLGRPIDNKLQHLAKSVLPVAVQSLTESLNGAGWAGTAASFGGLNYIPHSPYDTRDQFIQQQGYKDQLNGTPIKAYADLSESQRDAFDTQFPDYSKAVLAYQEERASPYAVAAHLRAQKTEAIAALGKAFRGGELTDEEASALGIAGNAGSLAALRNNPQQYRKMLQDLQVKYRYETDAVLKNKAQTTPDSAQQKVVQGFYTEVIDKAVVGGSLNYDLMDDLERAYRDKVLTDYGAEGLRLLDQETIYRISDDPVAAAYHKDQALLDPYYKNQDRFFNSTALQEVAGFDKASADFAAANYSSASAYRVHLTDVYIEQLAGQPLSTNLANLTVAGKPLSQHYGITPGKRLTEEQARLVAEAVVSRTFRKWDDAITNENNKYLKRNPETACALKYWGYTMPVDAAPLLATCSVRFTE